MNETTPLELVQALARREPSVRDQLLGRFRPRVRRLVERARNRFEIADTDERLIDYTLRWLECFLTSRATQLASDSHAVVQDWPVFYTYVDLRRVATVSDAD